MTEPTVIATIPKNSKEEVRVSLSEYQGRQRSDVRQFADYMVGPVQVRGPTKQGVSLKGEQLPDLIAGLCLARDEAVRRGIIPEQADGR